MILIQHALVTKLQFRHALAPETPVSRIAAVRKLNLMEVSSRECSTRFALRATRGQGGPLLRSAGHLPRRCPRCGSNLFSRARCRRAASGARRLAFPDLSHVVRAS